MCFCGSQCNLMWHVKYYCDQDFLGLFFWWQKPSFTVFEYIFFFSCRLTRTSRQVTFLQVMERHRFVTADVCQLMSSWKWLLKSWLPSLCKYVLLNLAIKVWSDKEKKTQQFCLDKSVPEHDLELGSWSLSPNLAWPSMSTSCLARVQH